MTSQITAAKETSPGEEFICLSTTVTRKGHIKKKELQRR